MKLPELLSDLLQNYGWLLERIVAFGAIFLCILLISRVLLHRLIFAVDPEAKSQRPRLRSRPVRIVLAIADIVAWLFALTLSCLIYQLPQVMQLLLSLFGLVWNLLPLSLVVLLIAYCFSRVGHELILSFIGFWVLRTRKADLDRQQFFDVGNGQMAKVEEVHVLVTKFRVKEGNRILFRPNAYLMQSFFGFSQSLGIEDLITWLRGRSVKR